MLTYSIVFSPQAVSHLRVLTARQRAVVRESVEVQLTVDPVSRTRNCKPMKAGGPASWELRVGELRIYYDVEEEPVPTVHILAIGIKRRRVVRIGREVIEP